MRRCALLLAALSACGGPQTMTDVKNMDGYESIHALLERCEAGVAMDPDAVGEEAVVELYERVGRVYSEVVQEEDPCDAIVAQLYEDDRGMIGARSIGLDEHIDTTDTCGDHCVAKLAPSVKPDANHIRIFVVGDMGLDGAIGAQEEVAAGVRRVCFDEAAPDNQCDLGLLLGDNVYDAGIDEPEDAARLEEMVARYTPEGVNAPIYLVLGNHDWRKVFPSRDRARAQLEWIGSEDGVRGNAHYYTFEAGPAALWGMDTNYLVRRTEAASELEANPFTTSLHTASASWKIAFGHHPYLSNGHHGNAGAYRDFFEDEGFRGRIFERYMETHVMPEVDLYLAGHEHSMQFFPAFDQFGRTMAASVVTGAGAKSTGTTALMERCNSGGVASDFEYYDNGFTVLDITETTLTVGFYSEAGELVWSTRKTRAVDAPETLTDAVADAQEEVEEKETLLGKLDEVVTDAAEAVEDAVTPAEPLHTEEGSLVEPLGVETGEWTALSEWNQPGCGDPSLVAHEH